MKYITNALLIGLVLSVAPLSAQETNPADFNGDGKVNFADFLLFAQGFGKSTGDEGFDAKLDLNGNGSIDFADFLQFAAAFGSGDSTNGSTEPENLLLYVADFLDDRIEIYDATTNLRDSNSPLFVSRPRGLAFSNINNQFYVAGTDTFYSLTSMGQRVYAIPLHEGDIAGIESRGGFKVALSSDHKQVFVTEAEGSLVEVFNSSDGRSIAQIPVPASPSGIVVSPDGNEVFVAHGISFISSGNRPLSVIDGVNHIFKDSISVGKAIVTRMAISPDGQRLYLNDTASRKIRVVDVAARAVVDSFSVGLSSDADAEVLDLKLSKDGTRLFAVVNRVVVGFDNLGNQTFASWAGVSIIDTATGSISGEIQVGQFVSALAVTPDGKIAYVLGVENTQGGSLLVMIVDLETGELLGTLRGFVSPIAVTLGASKPAISLPDVLELIIF